MAGPMPKRQPRRGLIDETTCKTTGANQIKPYFRNQSNYSLSSTQNLFQK